MWYMIRNLRCTVTIDSVLANSKTKNSFLFTVNAIFRHDYPLAVEPGSSPRPLVQKKFGEILYILICSFLPCLSWLLRSRVRKSRRELRITLYTVYSSQRCDLCENISLQCCLVATVIHMQAVRNRYVCICTHVLHSKERRWLGKINKKQ